MSDHSAAKMHDHLKRQESKALLLNGFLEKK
jgi:hypothetical protein